MLLLPTTTTCLAATLGSSLTKNFGAYMPTSKQSFQQYAKKGKLLKGGYPIIFESNVFPNSHLIQKCIQNQQQLLILYTFLNQMRVVKNIRRKDDRMKSL